MKSQISLAKRRQENNLLFKLFFSVSPLIIFHIEENSMLPFLIPGNKVLVNKLAYLFRKPQPGDIIVAKNPTKDPKRLYVIKRVKKINKNSIYITGDNGVESIDSKQYGWISTKKIVGKMIGKIY